MYGQKQAGHVWNQYLDEGMIEAGFHPSKWDPCLYYCKSVIILMYIDDCLMLSPSNDLIDGVLKDLREQGFTIDAQGEVQEFWD